MDNPWDTIRAALSEARSLNDALERQSNTMADVLTGRLRKVDPYHLRKLKRELRDFDMTTGKWRRS